MLVIWIFLWLFPCLITVLRDWARDYMTLSLFTIWACNNFFANLCSASAALEDMILSATTRTSCCLRRCSRSLARPPPTGWAGAPKPSSAELFLVSPFSAQSCDGICPWALWRFVLICIPPPSTKDLLGTLMKTSRNSCLQFPDLWYRALHIPNI